MTQIDLSIFDKEEDVALLLDILKEEYFFRKVSSIIPKLGNISDAELDEVADVIASEFMKFAAEAEDAKDGATSEDAASGEDTYYNVSLSGYDVNTWMDYWFGISKPGESLKSNGVFFTVSKERMGLINERINKLSGLFGYEVEHPADSPGQSVIKGTPFQYLEGMSQDFKSIKEKGNKENVAAFLNKYQDKLFRQLRIDPKEPERAKIKTDIINYINGKMRTYSEELSSGQYISKIIDFSQPKGGKNKEKGEGVTTIGIGGELEIKQELKKETTDAIKNKSIEAYTIIDALQKEINDLTSEKNEITKSLQSQAVDQDSATTRLSEIDNKIKENNIKIENVSKGIEDLYSYRSRNVSYLEKAKEDRIYWIQRYTQALEAMSKGPDLTEEDFNIEAVGNIISGLYGPYGYDLDTKREYMRGFLFEAGHFKDEEETFMKFLEDSKGNVTDIPDTMFDVIKTETENSSSKHIQFAEAQKVASDAILNRILEYFNKIQIQYVETERFVEAIKNQYIDQIKRFNGDTSFKKTMYTQLLNSAKHHNKYKEYRDQGPASLDKYYGKAFKVAYPLFTQNNIFSDKEVIDDLNKIMVKTREVVNPVTKAKQTKTTADVAYWGGSKQDHPLLRNEYMNLFTVIKSLVNLYKSRSPEKSGNISREDINFYRSLKEKTDEAYNILSSFHQGVLKKIVSHPNYNTLSGHTKEMVQKYQEKVGQIVDILRDVPVEAFTIENTEDLPRKVEGEKLLLSVLNYMRDNNQFSINDFSSMIKSFSEIPQYKDVIDINYYLSLVNKEKILGNKIVKKIEKAITPLKKIMSSFLQKREYVEKPKEPKEGEPPSEEATPEKPIGKKPEEKKESMEKLYGKMSSDLEESLKNSIGEYTDYSKDALNDLFLAEFSSRMIQSPNDVKMKDVTNILDQDPIYASNFNNLKKIPTYTRVSKDEMASKDWNSLYIFNDWKAMIIQCLKSLQSCRRSENESFDPTNSPYSPNVNYSNMKEEAAKTKNIYYPGQRTEQEELLAGVRRFQNTVSGGSLSLLFSDKSRENRRYSLGAFFEDTLEEYLKLFGEYRERFKERSDLMGILNKCSSYFESLLSVKDIDSIEKSKESIRVHLDKIYGILESISVTPEEDLYRSDLESIFRDIELLKVSEINKPGNLLVFKYLYTPEQLTDEEKTKSEEIRKHMKQYSYVR